MAAASNTAKPTISARFIAPSSKASAVPGTEERLLGRNATAIFASAGFSAAKVLRQFEALSLIVRADAGAVKLIGPRQHFLVDQPADDLAVFEDERHLARPHFEDGARAGAARAGIAEAGIEEAGIVDAEFADQ